ncbi:MAG: hypothetical protein LBG96_03180 [Tannerella sp.]|jgi:hypothetical protein|nr:hypothetical protein [Tannerella sp.]
MNNYVSYDFFKKVDDGSKLGKFFNIVFDKICVSRILFSPKFYEREEKENVRIRATSSIHFYELCLGELYLHSVITGLNRWKEILSEYNGEFQGRWKYYALSKRMDAIRRYGGEDGDYNPDGSIREGVDNARLSCYTVVNDLVSSDYRDIFTDSRPENLFHFARQIVTGESMSITDMFKSCFGKKLPTYRMEGGQMVEIRFSEELLMRIERENSACLVANTLLAVCNRISELVDTVKSLDRYQDNGKFLSAILPSDIDKLFNMEVEPLAIFDPAKHYQS